MAARSPATPVCSPCPRLLILVGGPASGFEAELIRAGLGLLEQPATPGVSRFLNPPPAAAAAAAVVEPARSYTANTAAPVVVLSSTQIRLDCLKRRSVARIFAATHLLLVRGGRCGRAWDKGRVCVQCVSRAQAR